MNIQDAKAIELVIFKLISGLSRDKVKTSLKSLEPLLKSYKGFISRKLAVNEQCQWMDLVFWESLEDAKFASEDVLEQEKVQKVFEVIDKNEINFFHFEPVN